MPYIVLDTHEHHVINPKIDMFISQLHKALAQHTEISDTEMILNLHYLINSLHCLRIFPYLILIF
jgi:hypothetical protein